MARLFLRITILSVSLGIFLGTRSWAEEVVVILSSASGPYQEAFEGFQQGFGRVVPSYNISQDEPEIKRDTKVVVVFGAKAASRDYPQSVVVVYGLAPSFKIKPGIRFLPPVKVHTQPSAAAVVKKIKEFQPAVKHPAVFWVSESYLAYSQEFQKTAQALGLEAFTERLSGMDRLPDRLRSLSGKVDAIWILPDPLLVNAQSFAVLKDFSWANDVPLYVPTAGLAENGAAIAVYYSFKEIGRTAAQAAKQALAGPGYPGDIFPERSETLVNLKGAANAGLVVPSDALKRADRVLP